jgi:hypothetical protein
MGGLAGGGSGKGMDALAPSRYKEDITGALRKPGSAFRKPGNQLNDLFSAPDPIKAPELPPPVIQDKTSVTEAGESEMRKPRKGYSSTVVTGKITPKAKGKTSLGS